MPEEMRTLAEAVSEELGDDGHNLCDKRGTTLSKLCKEKGARRIRNKALPGMTRYLFDDGSAIIDIGEKWGLEHPDHTWILAEDEPD